MNEVKLTIVERQKLPGSTTRWPAARIVHLGGGCQAICNFEPHCEISPNVLSGKPFRIAVPDFWSLYSVIESHKLQIIGVEFVVDTDQANGVIPTEWRFYHHHTKSIWAFDVIQEWRGISRSAFNDKRGKLSDLAARIAYQLKICEWRIKEVCEAYSRQLRSRVLEGAAIDTGISGYDNLWVWQSYAAVHGFLFDACVLRDRLAEFAAHFIYGPKLGMTKITVSSAASLKKMLPQVGDSDSLTVSLAAAMEDKGWLKELGAYRDLIMHIAPLARAEKRLLAQTRVHSMGSERLPYVTCPLPPEPDAIMKLRSTDDYFQDFDAMIEAYASTQNSENQKDALAYCHNSLSGLLDLAQSLSERSPVPATTTIFNEIARLGEIDDRVNVAAQQLENTKP